MKTINNFILEHFKDSKLSIIERLKLNSESKIKQKKEFVFSDEELRKDYFEVSRAITKAEKEAIANKYMVNVLKIRDIQLVILDFLRKNRNNKTEFTEEDIFNFSLLDPPDGNYNKYVKYLEQESDEFLKYMLQYYINKAAHIGVRRRTANIGLSSNDRRILKIVDSLKKYLKVA